MNDYDYDLLKSNLRNYLENRGINTNKMFRCINPAHSDSNASMKYYDDNKVYCFGCGASYNLFDVISIMENLSQKEAFKRALDYYSYGKLLSPVKPINKPKIDKTEENKLKDYSKAYSIWKHNLEKEKPALEYLKGREIDEKTAQKFNLGYNEFKFGDRVLKAIVIPINENTFTARNIDKTDTEFRYYKAKGNHTDIFNKSALTNNIPFCFITEGEFDCLSFESVGANAVALGSTCNISKLKNLDIDKKKTYILALDNDEAGLTAKEELEEFFKENNIKYRQFDNCGFKDSNEALIADKDTFQKSIFSLLKKLHLQENCEM